MTEQTPNPDNDSEDSLLDNLIMQPDDQNDHESEPPKRRSKMSDVLGDSYKSKKSRANSDRPRTSSTRTAAKKKDEFVEPLTAMYTMVGTVMIPFDQPCGTAVITSAEQCAKALDNLAAKDERVRKALRTLTTGSAYGEVIIAHAPIMLAILAHHFPGALPGGKKAVENGEDESSE